MHLDLYSKFFLSSCSDGSANVAAEVFASTPLDVEPLVPGSGEWTLMKLVEVRLYRFETFAFAQDFAFGPL